MTTAMAERGVRGRSRRCSTEGGSLPAAALPAGGPRKRGSGAGSLAASNAELLGRVQRLSPVLVELARDLAGARRESAVLRRENELLRSRVDGLETAGTLRPAGRGR